MIACRREHIVERIVVAVIAGEDKHIRDVVQETRTILMIAHIAISYTAREQLISVTHVDQAGVEHRPVARRRAVFDDRRGAELRHERIVHNTMSHRKHLKILDRTHPVVVDGSPIGSCRPRSSTTVCL